MKSLLLLWLIVVSLVPSLEAKRGSDGRGNKSKEDTKSRKPRLSILGIAEANFTTLATALKIADLDWIYGCSKECRAVTFLAPTNAAFAALDPAHFTMLTTDLTLKEHLIQLLEYHVLRDEILSAEFRNGLSYRNVQGATINVTVSGTAISLNGGATLTGATDIKATNGVVHGIGSVLVPTFLTTDLVDTIKADPVFSTLAAALDSAPNVTATLRSGNYTFFAPDNAAFARLATNLTALLADTVTLTSILSYHAIPNVLLSKYSFTDSFLTTLQGGKIEIVASKRRIRLDDLADIDSFNKLASNAIIHTIDQVLSPPTPLVDLIDSAKARSDLSSLVQAVTAASLVQDFQGTGPFTCFFPTDEAVTKLPNSTLTALMSNTTALAQILLYHCVSGLLMLDDLHDSRQTTLQGEALVLEGRSHKRFRINDDVDVVEFDILATNGVIHLIDEVLEIPAPLPTIAEYLATDSDFDKLFDALNVTGMISTLQEPGNFTLFAPDDGAFSRYGSTKLAKLLNDTSALANVLSYHVITDEIYKFELEDTILKASNGANLRIDVEKKGREARLNRDSRVREFDIACSNGVIHRIKDILTVPLDLKSTLQANGLTKLAAAITAAGLDAALGSGDFTLFAPTDRAFSNVAGLDNLMADPTSLKTILEYHLVPARNLLADDLVKGMYGTVQGGSIEVDYGKKGRWLQVNDAWVLDLNILASNGVVHIINKVLSPSGVAISN